MLILALSIFSLHYAQGFTPRVDPLVQIDQGLVRGLKSADGRYSTFMGIPYAQVDLDDPFGPSQSHPGFGNATFNAYDGTKKCPQAYDISSDDYEETLDCLLLNIYVPSSASSRNPLPVLVWIHGGAFVNGYAGGFDGAYFMRHDIILVAINYRLGPYGFMCLDVPSVPGNQGLKDQNEALIWVRKNIAAFGGNPYNVTIAGQSAGAISVLLHLYSSKDKLYNKAIVQSGTPHIDGGFVNADVDVAIKLAEYLGLPTTDTEEALTFLAKTPHNLVTGALQTLDITLRPCKESSFSGIENIVDSDPFSMTNERKIRNTPILIGHTDKEIGELKGNWLEMLGYKDYFSQDPFKARIAKNFNLDDAQLEEAANIVRHFYIGDESASEDLSTQLEIFESDFIFNHPVEREIVSLLNDNANPVYKYLFSYTGDSGAVGAEHSAELKFLFGGAGEQNDEERLLTDRITTLWANFIKYGNPTPSATDLIPVVWEPVSVDTRPHLLIDADISVGNRAFKEKMSFWDIFYTIYQRYNKLIRECNL